MKVLFIGLMLLSVNVAAHSGPEVPEPMTLTEISRAFGWDLETIQNETERVTDGLSVLFGAGGNIAVTVGDQGVLVVDDQFPELEDKIRAAIKSLGGDRVDFAVNTHWHFDHADGNQFLGPDGTWIVAQSNSRAKMTEDQIINLVGVSYAQKAYPPAALPVMTYDDRMQFHFNDQEIELMHFGAAHTTGDTAVFFRGDNAVHLGDVYNNSGYPFIDAGNGGTLDGLIAFCQATLKEIDEETIVIPGHGPISDYQGLTRYIAMLTDIRAKMMALILDGASLEEVVAAKVTAAYDAEQGDPNLLVNRAYFSLTHKVVDR